MKQGAREGARQSFISGLGRLCCWRKDSGSSPLSSRPPPPSSTRHPASFPDSSIYVCIPEEGLATSLVHCWGGGMRILPGPPDGLLAPPASPSWVMPLTITLLTTSLIFIPTRHTQGHTARISSCVQLETWPSP